jgi:multisubunit Na+/H+ antiporter MnhC subunit
MPVTSILILSGIVLAFAAFAAALVWGDIQTQRAQRQRSHIESDTLLQDGS